MSTRWPFASDQVLRERVNTAAVHGTSSSSVVLHSEQGKTHRSPRRQPAAILPPLCVRGSQRSRGFPCHSTEPERKLSPDSSEQAGGDQAHGTRSGTPVEKSRTAEPADEIRREPGQRKPAGSENRAVAGPREVG